MNCSIKARRRMSMKLIKMEKVKDGKYLKTYEIVSRKELSGIEDIGQKVSGLSIAAVNGDKLLLLREFRMGVNKIVYNLCAGMLEEGESLEQCIRRELYEETGLQVKRIIDILPASYAAVAISDTKTSIVFVEAEGEFEDHTSDNEWIEAGFYTKEEVRELLKTAEFSSRAQIIAYFFARGVL